MLAFGLGLTTGGFTFVNGLFFRGFPVPDSDQVFLVQPVFRETVGRVDDGLSYGAYRHIASNADLADYVASGAAFVNIGTQRDTRSSGSVPFGLYVSDNFFQALRIPLQMGTPPRPAGPGTPPTVVISHQTWQTIFAGDPNILGRTAWLGGHPSTIVGVTTPDFTGLGRQTMIYAPLWAAPVLASGRNVGDVVANETTCCVSVAGRERRGASRAAILSELDGLTMQYRSSIGRAPLTLSLPDTSVGSAVTQRGGVAAVLAMLAAAALLLLILTCANVGNLYLARSLRRQHEVVTRLALGASRARLVRQFLTEGLALSSLAGVAAFGVAAAIPKVMILSGADLSAASFSPDWRVALVTALAVFAVCAFISLAPALRATRVVWRGSAATATARSGRLRGGLLAVQIAIATVLILSAALIARGIQFGVSAPSDFALKTTTAAVLEWAAGVRPTAARLQLFRANLAAGIQASDVPMGLATQIPVSDNAGLITSVRRSDANVNYDGRVFAISTSGADVLGLRLVAGRWASDSDAALEAVINETMARQVFGEQSPVGQPLQLAYNDTVYAVVGVTADAHILSPGRVEPIIHIPPTRDMPVLLTEKTPAAEASVRALVGSIEPSLTVRFVPLTESIRTTVEDATVGAVIAAGLGVVALLLATIGVYSVFSYLVEEHRREIGIRVALGASRVQIRSAVFRAARGGLIGGVATGLVLAAIAGLVLRRFLFGMSPADPVSYLAVALLLTGTALVAVAVPLRRALRANPSGLLKAD
jgi:predicted permease